MSSLVIEYKGYPKEDIFLLTEQRSSFPRTCGGDPELYKYFKNISSENEGRSDLVRTPAIQIKLIYYRSGT